MPCQCSSRATRSSRPRPSQTTCGNGPQVRPGRHGRVEHLDALRVVPGVSTGVQGRTQPQQPKCVVRVAGRGVVHRLPVAGDRLVRWWNHVDRGARMEPSTGVSRSGNPNSLSHTTVPSSGCRCREPNSCSRLPWNEHPLSTLDRLSKPPSTRCFRRSPAAGSCALAKSRWRTEHDYRELKDGLGLDHFEGHSWLGNHRHAILAGIAHAICAQLRRIPRPSRCHQSTGPRSESEPPWV